MVCPVIGSGSRTLEAKNVRHLFLLTKLTEALEHLTVDCRPVCLDAGVLSIVDMGTTGGYVGPPLSVQRPNEVINRRVSSRMLLFSGIPTETSPSLFRLSATTELLMMNLIPQHDPKPVLSLWRTATTAFPKGC